MNPQVVASECCSALRPKNSLSGFQFCLESAVDGIEFDVHLSKDGHVVVQHDYLLNPRITRDASGQWLEKKGPAVCDLSLEQLSTFDIGRYKPGSREAKEYADYQPMDGERIPTLDALLRAYQAAGSEAQLWIELKTSPFDREISSDPNDLLAAVLSLVEEFGLVSKTVLLAFEWQLLIDAAGACPGIGRDFLTINPAFIRSLYKNNTSIRPEDMYLPLDPDEHGGSFAKTIANAGANTGGSWWGPYIADVTASDVEFARECGVQTNVWGVASNGAAIEEALLLCAEAITLSDSALLQRRLRV